MKGTSKYMEYNRNEVRLSICRSEGELNYFLIAFGDHIAEREGYKNLDGLDAIQHYLIHKFHWLPRDVRAMTHEDMRLVLSQELEGHVFPPEVRA
ncbi:hypothetical protein [Chromobacterium vaccinii]|uniref:hypothetical protein n=1 Tax=Chromobacterium vaccinii TaxID=1108595 RepID=UPI0034589692